MSLCSYPGLTEGLYIQLNYPAEEWREQVDALEDPELREGADRYLRSMVIRENTLKKFARESGCRNMDEWEALRKEARRHGAPGARAWHRAGRPERWRRGSAY